MWLRERLTRPVSPRARWIHVLLGSFMPIVFLVFDPIVFRAGTFALGGATFGQFRMAGYTATVLAAILLARAVIRERTTAVEAGMLYGAAAVSLVLGIVLLPLSLVGLLIGIGVLGLSPFVTAWIYARHAARHGAWSKRVAAGALLFLAMVAGAQLLTNTAVTWAVRHPESATATPALRACTLIYDSDQLVSRYQSTQSGAEKHLLSEAHRRMTRTLIEERLARLAD